MAVYDFCMILGYCFGISVHASRILELIVAGAERMGLCYYDHALHGLAMADVQRGDMIGV